MITDKDIITLLLTKGLGPKSLNSIIDEFETNDSSSIMREHELFLSITHRIFKGYAL